MLTKLETTTLLALRTLTEWCDPGFSDVEAMDLETETGIPTNRLCGVIASLSKKGLISVEDADVNGKMKYFYYMTDKGTVLAKIIDVGVEDFILLA